MRTALAGLTVLAIAAPAEAAPWTLSLDGPWRFTEAEGKPANLYQPGTPGTWRPMSLPGRWYRRGLDVHGAVWFRKNFTVPAAQSRAWLDFGGVDYAMDAWLDGRWVGHHVGGSAPFRLAIGSLPAGAHELNVRVDSPYEPIGSAWSLHKRTVRGILNHHDTRPGGAWSDRGQDHNAGGIWGSVRLRGTGPTAIAGVDMRPHVTDGRGWLGMSVMVDHAGPSVEARLTATLTPVGGGPAERFTKDEILSKGVSTVEWRLKPAKAPRLWSTWDRGGPQLYRLSLSVAVDGRPSDAWTRNFGFREVERLRDGTFALNGRRIFLRGTNYISSPWPDASDAARLRQDVALMKTANVNAVRVHAHTEPEAFYDACDAAGLLIWQDLPLQWGYADTPEVTSVALRTAREMMEGMGHHPSIFAWCAHNEAPYSAEWMKDKYEDYDPKQNRNLDHLLVNALRFGDTTRYAHPNSDTVEHPWLGWYSGSWLDFARPTGESLITEYGAQALPAQDAIAAFIPSWARWPQTDKAWALWEYHNFQRHEAFDIAKVPQGPDLPTWIANSQAYQARLIDFAATRYRLQKYRPVGAIFQFHLLDPWPSAAWGAMDWNRRPKAGYDAMKLAYQPTLPVIDAMPTQSADRALRLPLLVVHDGLNAVPGCTVRWWLFDDAGKNLRSGTAPGDLPADGIGRFGAIALDPLPKGGYSLALQVVDAQGKALGEHAAHFTLEAR